MTWTPPEYQHKRDRQFRGRLKHNKCPRHNTPLERALTFDGSTCSLGCILPETARVVWRKRLGLPDPWKR